jgi:hypothetical protein
MAVEYVAIRPDQAFTGRLLIRQDITIQQSPLVKPEEVTVPYGQTYQVPSHGCFNLMGIIIGYIRQTRKVL